MGLGVGGWGLGHSSGLEEFSQGFEEGVDVGLVVVALEGYTDELVVVPLNEGDFDLVALVEAALGFP